MGSPARPVSGHTRKQYYSTDFSLSLLSKTVNYPFYFLCFTAKQKKVVVVDADGNVVYNAKTGKPKTKFVKDSRSTEKSYNKAAATKAFKEACGIVFKPTGFKARERRTEAYYNPFEGLM
jgi:hypothetical protein